ncbi:MAG: metalloregulator ArsR/SmtB family transcription factor [Bacteroidota bacterium]
MGLIKTDFYIKKHLDMAHIFKVLGHPARIAILEHLLKIDTCICGDLVDEIGLSQSTISQHLKELKNLDLIQGTIQGTSVCYCINFSKWNEISGVTNEFFNNNPNTAANCC